MQETTNKETSPRATVINVSNNIQINNFYIAYFQKTHLYVRNFQLLQQKPINQRNSEENKIRRK